MTNPTIIEDLKENPLKFDQILQILDDIESEGNQPKSWDECDAGQQELIVQKIKEFVNNFGDELMIVDTSNGPEITTK